jgi:hypothetical protein
MREGSWLVTLGLVLVTSLGSAEADSGPEARLGCGKEAAPGRVLCELELEVTSGRISWADALVTGSPAFAKPLRSRVAGGQAATPRRIRIQLALAATERGSGKLQVLARSVVCRPKPDEDGELCDAHVRPVEATVVVGADTRPGG